MAQPSLSITTARRLALHTQLLGDPSHVPAGKEGVAHTIEHLGYVQIDPLTVIRRAHHHTLWSRRPDYHPDLLHQLQAVDRRVFEYWAHALCYLPMSDYRFYLPRMRNFGRPTKNRWVLQRLEQHGHLMQPVIEVLRAEGPLDAPGIAAALGDQTGRTAVRDALDLLFWKGDVMVTERRDFRKIYDLAERILPPGLDTSLPDQDELGRFLVRRALAALGLATEKEIALFTQPETSRDDHMQAAGRETIAAALHELIDAGEVAAIHIKGESDIDNYTLVDSLEQADRLPPIPPQVTLLSPFDNLITQRERIRRLWNFDYVLECYIPPAKRKHGYFVLPILWGEHFVARLDPKADRQRRTLIIRSLAFEPEFTRFDEFLPLLAGKLATFARFNLCDQVEFEKVNPASAGSALKSLMSAALAAQSPA
ncbi:MAG: YcaQ family DNA glycosylase [Fidelibacterota bacterium]|nr:MAG: YcaQ family DNA glycosylase [Candidatus Neomarinimicrobiota bacterium]